MARLSNEVRPEKLHRALQMCGIEIPMESITMSAVYDGYTVNASQATKDRVHEIHEEFRRRFHLTQPMAIALYQEVRRRYGENSVQYREMNEKNNQGMRRVEHPWLPGSYISAPPKIFHCVVLLDVVIPQWEFNGYDGYLISAQDPGVIDQLERVADWSQQQAALEGGAQSSFGSTLARGSVPSGRGSGRSMSERGRARAESDDSGTEMPRMSSRAEMSQWYAAQSERRAARSEARQAAQAAAAGAQS